MPRRFRHFQPASRYARAAEARFVGRTEDLGALVGALRRFLPVLDRSLGGDASRLPEAWLVGDAKIAVEGGKVEGWTNQSGSLGLYNSFDRGHDLERWAVRRCDLAPFRAEIDATVADLYETDLRCFGAVLPGYPGAQTSTG